MLEFARTAEAIGTASSTLEKSRLLAAYLRELDTEDAARAAVWMSGQPYGRGERKRLNAGWAAISGAVRELSGLGPEELSRLFLKHSDLGEWAEQALAGRTRAQPASLAEVAAAFEEVRTARTAVVKRERLRDLLAHLDPLAVKYAAKILGFELRIGLQEGLVEAAIGQAYDVPIDTVRRVHMLTGDIGETARRCRSGELGDAGITLFQPFRFMLATPVDAPAEVFERMGTELVWTEEKYDGVRCQLHRTANGRCELFSRDLKETTAAFPEVVEGASALGHELVLDGEILAHDGIRVLPFFDLQRRLGRKQVPAVLRREVPVVFVAFDLLHLDGEVVMTEPLRERRRRLERLGLAPPFLLARRESAVDPDDLGRIFEETRERGNEGLMVKDPDSAYSPGRRGMAWLKLKRPLATLDVVVTAVEWGHGKRRGVLSDYTFAVRDPDGRLLNVGKAYSGLTDEEIARMTRFFLAHTVADHGRVRVVEPNTVIEVAFDSIQRSNRHHSGFALRFPRIVDLRPDKPVDEIDTLARVEELHRRWFARGAALADVAEVEPGEVAGGPS